MRIEAAIWLKAAHQGLATPTMAARAKKVAKPFKQLDAESQVERLHQRGRELQCKKMRQEMIQALYDNDHILFDVHKYMQTLGVDFRSSGKPGRAAQGEGQPVASLPELIDQEEPRASPMKMRSPGGIIDPNPNNWVPHKYTKIANSSVAFVKGLLSQIEEISMSTVALQCLITKGAKDAKVSSLAELLEFATCFSREEPLVGCMRHIPTLVDYFKKCNHVTGRRARDLRLPASWSKECGVYSLKPGDGDEVIVKDNVTHIQHPIPEAERPKYLTGELVPIDELDIGFNFNSAKAVVCSPACMTKVHIISLGKFFTGLMPMLASRTCAVPQISQPPLAKKRKALADGVIGEGAGDDCAGMDADSGGNDSMTTMMITDKSEVGFSPPLPSWAQPVEAEAAVAQPAPAQEEAGEVSAQE